ncbi:MAG: type II toxin-antitoxin system VapC family toxin [Planctomycetes bacterium]|nr:type II toxin-antitoxin system VapC family toxin [Planctomycetota bacterium]
MRRFCGAAGHLFWTDDISLRDVLLPDIVLTHGQITDAYLLALAVQKGGKLASLDQRIPAAAVPGGADALELIAP